MIAIVGGGLAGISLAIRLKERGIDFLIFSNGIASASHISSGVMNPITGRRYALAWQFNRFRDAAISFYGEFLSKIPIKRYYKPYSETSTSIEDLVGKEEWAKVIDPKWVDIHESYQLKVPAFISYWMSQFASEERVISEDFDHTQLNINEKTFTYKKRTFDKLIFAEGIGIVTNPFFNHLPFRPNRGEALRIVVPELNLEKIIQKGKFICKFENDFWVGSSFENVSTSEPIKTQEQYTMMCTYIPDLIEQKKYEVVEHLGAFRVTIPDRRPIIGGHPSISGLYIFNGFGTKGVSHVPYFSRQLIDHIFDHSPIDIEVDISRFIK